MNLPLEGAKSEKRIAGEVGPPDHSEELSLSQNRTNELEGDEMEKELQLGQVECLEEVEATPDTESMISMREILDAFNLPHDSTEDVYPYEKGDLWDMMDDLDEHEGLEQKIVQYIRENPGRSYNAIFNHFKKEGFTYTEVLETYNVLVYSKKILLRVNVGTDTSPRYAHFVMEFFVPQPEKDVLYDILGPV